MSKKVLVGFLLVLSLLLSSCYPELSVQQYDKLRAELEAMDIERNESKAELAAIQAEKADFDANKAETLAYVEFLDTLLSAERGAMILYGQLDIAAVSDYKDELASAAEQLGDSELTYYVELIDPDNGSQSIAAYYKIIEGCLQKIKQNLK